jgi:hypothetical protein
MTGQADRWIILLTEPVRMPARVRVLSWSSRPSDDLRDAALLTRAEAEEWMQEQSAAWKGWIATPAPLDGPGVPAWKGSPS